MPTCPAPYTFPPQTHRHEGPHPLPRRLRHPSPARFPAPSPQAAQPLLLTRRQPSSGPCPPRCERRLAALLSPGACPFGTPAFAHAAPTARLLLLCLKSLACFKNQLRDSGAPGARVVPPQRPVLLLLPGAGARGSRRRPSRGLVPPALHRCGGDHGSRAQRQTPGASTLLEAAPPSRPPSSETTLPKTAAPGGGGGVVLLPRRTSRALSVQTTRQSLFQKTPPTGLLRPGFRLFTAPHPPHHMHETQAGG